MDEESAPTYHDWDRGQSIDQSTDQCSAAGMAYCVKKSGGYIYQMSGNL